MNEDEKISLRDFKKGMRALRSSNDFKEDLESIIRFLKWSKEYTFIELEALLIEATNERYENSIERDAALMAFGLLKGFNNRNDERGSYDGRKLVRERRHKFLKESLYMEMTYKGTYEKMEKRELLNLKGEVLVLETAMSTLGTNDGKYINNVSQKIYSKGENILDYIRKHPKDYFDNAETPGVAMTLKLPLIENVRKNLNLDEETLEKPENGSKAANDNTEGKILEFLSLIKQASSALTDINVNIKIQIEIKEETLRALEKMSSVLACLVLIFFIGWLCSDSRSTFGQNIEPSSELVISDVLPTTNPEMNSNGIVDEPQYTQNDFYDELIQNQEKILQKQARMEGKYYDEKEY